MQTILITGANGFLGQHLVKLLLEKQYTVIGIGKKETPLLIQQYDHFIYYSIDITNDSLTHNVINKHKPDIIIHAAAITQPDECQLNQEKCEEVNVRSTAQLLLSAEAFSKKFIYISTDFVFDGEKGNYSEDDNINPVNWYGFTKAQAESIVQTSTIPWTIVRTCLVYGNALAGTRNNIISWVKKSIENNETIKVVNDQWRTPTYVEDLAQGILLIVQQQATGIYHVSGNDTLTPYHMAIKTAAYFNLPTSLIQEVNASSFTQPAVRPLKTGFTINKAQTQLGFAPISFEEGLQKMFS